MPRPIVYYVRHGQTDWNAELRFQGQRDIPLNDTGREQARQNGKRLAATIENAGDYKFISSPMVRTRETMQLIRTEMGLDPDDFETDERLIEASYGDWEGFTLPDIKQQFPDEHKRRKRERWTFSPPSGESHRDILERVSDWYGSLSGNSIVIAHGVVGRVLRYHILGLDGQTAAEFVFPQDKVFRFEAGAETFV